MSAQYTMPSQAEIDAAILRAHVLRAEFTAELFRSAFGAVAAIPSRIAAALHRPAHG